MSGVELYQDESDCAAKLAAWSQWRRGDGVRGQVSTITWAEDEALLRRELNRDNFRLPTLVSDAEHTDRAIAMMKRDDNKAWLALECYHLSNSATRRVARACKARHHTEVPAILRRAHGTFWYCRAMTKRDACGANTAPNKAMQPINA